MGSQMKKLIKSIPVIFFLLASITHAYASTDIEAIASFQASIKKNANLVWPDLVIGNRPFIIAMNDSSGSLYAFDFTPQNKAGKKNSGRCVFKLYETKMRLARMTFWRSKLSHRSPEFQA